MIELVLAAESALALGHLDEAERTYRQVLSSDPRNGIAAVGLARVALERGDEAGAIRLARSALEVDAENATARRMIDRLEEVSRFRGEAGLPEVAADAPAADSTPVTSRLPEQPPGEATAGELPPATPQPDAAPPDAAPQPGTASPPAPRPQPTPVRRGLLRRLFRRP